MSDVTIVFYTANWEAPEFDLIVREALIAEIGGRPLVSVSQKPLPGFGKNICIGEQGGSLQNVYRQMLVGVEAAETEWVATAEDDSFYPPGYFDHDPGDTDFWMYSNVWRLRRHDPDRFIPCGWSDGWLFARRAPLLAALTMRLRHTPGFGPGRVKRPLGPSDCQPFDVGPGISVKTGRSLGSDYGKQHPDLEAAAELSGWGSASAFSEKVFAH